MKKLNNLNDLKYGKMNIEDIEFISTPNPKLDKIISSINYEGPFALTTDYLHKLTLGDNISISNDLGDLNIKECIVEYIDSLDVENKLAVTKKTISLYNQFV